MTFFTATNFTDSGVAGTTDIRSVEGLGDGPLIVNTASISMEGQTGSVLRGSIEIGGAEVLAMNFNGFTNGGPFVVNAGEALSFVRAGVGGSTTCSLDITPN